MGGRFFVYAAGRFSGPDSLWKRGAEGLFTPSGSYVSGCTRSKKEYTFPRTDTSKQKPRKPMVSGVFLAEREGFEPSVPLWGTHDFQSCALDQLSHLSMPQGAYII